MDEQELETDMEEPPVLQLFSTMALLFFSTKEVGRAKFCCDEEDDDDEPVPPLGDLMGTGSGITPSFTKCILERW